MTKTRCTTETTIQMKHNASNSDIPDKLTKHTYTAEQQRPKVMTPTSQATAIEELQKIKEFAVHAHFTPLPEIAPPVPPLPDEELSKPLESFASRMNGIANQTAPPRQPVSETKYESFEDSQKKISNHQKEFVIETKVEPKPDARQETKPSSPFKENNFNSYTSKVTEIHIEKTMTPISHTEIGFRPVEQDRRSSPHRTTTADTDQPKYTIFEDSQKRLHDLSEAFKKSETSPKLPISPEVVHKNLNTYTSHSSEINIEEKKVIASPQEYAFKPVEQESKSTALCVQPPPQQVSVESEQPKYTIYEDSQSTHDIYKAYSPASEPMHISRPTSMNQNLYDTYTSHMSELNIEKKISPIPQPNEQHTQAPYKSELPQYKDFGESQRFEELNKTIIKEPVSVTPFPATPITAASPTRNHVNTFTSHASEIIIEKRTTPTNESDKKIRPDELSSDKISYQPQEHIISPQLLQDSGSRPQLLQQNVEPRKESVLSPIYLNQSHQSHQYDHYSANTDIHNMETLRMASPRPSADAVAMEKLWTPTKPPVVPEPKQFDTASYHTSKNEFAEEKSSYRSQYSTPAPYESDSDFRNESDTDNGSRRQSTKETAKMFEKKIKELEDHEYNYKAPGLVRQIFPQSTEQQFKQPQPPLFPDFNLVPGEEPEICYTGRPVVEQRKKSIVESVKETLTADMEKETTSAISGGVRIIPAPIRKKPQEPPVPPRPAYVQPPPQEPQPMKFTKTMEIQEDNYSSTKTYNYPATKVPPQPAQDLPQLLREFELPINTAATNTKPMQTPYIQPQYNTSIQTEPHPVTMEPETYQKPRSISETKKFFESQAATESINTYKPMPVPKTYVSSTYHHQSTSPMHKKGFISSTSKCFEVRYESFFFLVLFDCFRVCFVFACHNDCYQQYFGLFYFKTVNSHVLNCVLYILKSVHVVSLITRISYSNIKEQRTASYLHFTFDLCLITFFFF